MGVLDLLLPGSCAGCGRAGASPCDRCLGSMRPWGHVQLGTGTVVAATAYDELSRRFVADLKQRGRRTSVAWMAATVVGVVGWAQLSADVVTWVPASVEGRRRRGFDQGRVLATAVGQRLGAPTARLLHRGPGGRQVGRDRPSRLAVAGTMVADGAVASLGRRRILVVDDVITTGASMAAAIDALTAAGADAVAGAAFAHKP